MSAIHLAYQRPVCLFIFATRLRRTRSSLSHIHVPITAIRAPHMSVYDSAYAVAYCARWMPTVAATAAVAIKSFFLQFIPNKTLRFLRLLSHSNCFIELSGNKNSLASFASSRISTSFVLLRIYSRLFFISKMDSLARMFPLLMFHISLVRIRYRNRINKNNYSIQCAVLWFAFDFTIHKPSKLNRILVHALIHKYPHIGLMERCVCVLRSRRMLRCCVIDSKLHIIIIVSM